ncbi:hypothetical protein [Bradyrhizobium sp. MOS003]|uniref:hypothetical protein n=1 Tax=Bradyrhizobium sp. MOS003 TaxID=2133946 RepID=UPI0018F39807|nr:hypothetical protein [Bradyrhizobium sp. MOS003]
MAALISAQPTRLQGWHAAVMIGLQRSAGCRSEQSGAEIEAVGQAQHEHEQNGGSEQGGVLENERTRGNGDDTGFLRDGHDGLQYDFKICRNNAAAASSNATCKSTVKGITPVMNGDTSPAHSRELVRGRNLNQRIEIAHFQRSPRGAQAAAISLS